MTFSQHAATAAPIGLAAGWWLQSPWAGVVAALAAVFIDCDHTLDYIAANNWRFQGIGHMTKLCYENRLKRWFLLAHSYEIWLIAPFVLPYFIPADLAWGLVIGVWVHLILDSLYNSVHPLGYFLVFRMIHGFRQEAFLRPGRNLAYDLTGWEWVKQSKVGHG